MNGVELLLTGYGVGIASGLVAWLVRRALGT